DKAGGHCDVYGSGIWAAYRAIAGKDCCRAGDGDGVCQRVFAAAGLFPDSVCGGARWEFLSNVRARAPARISKRLAAGAGGSGGVFLLLLTGGCDRSAGGAADSDAVSASACGRDLSAADTAGDEAAVPHLAVSAASCARDRRVYVYGDCANPS